MHVAWKTYRDDMQMPVFLIVNSFVIIQALLIQCTAHSINSISFYKVFNWTHYAGNLISTAQYNAMVFCFAASEGVSSRDAIFVAHID